MTRRTLAALTLIAAVAATTRAEDWPKWRGPNGDGISRETQPLTPWPAKGPKPLWTKDVGIGHASPVAVGGKVYAFASDRGHDVLYCFNAANGDEVWKQAYRRQREAKYPGTRATPTIEGDRIYTYGEAGDLTCRQLDDGKELWRTNVLDETGSRQLEWGTASSPLVVGDRINVQAGEGRSVAVAVDKNDGKIVWRSQAADKASYASIIHVEAAGAGGKPQLIVFAGQALYGMDPDTGKTLWREPWRTSYDVNAATPVYRDGLVLASSGYDHGSMMLKLSTGGAKKIWEKRDLKSKFQPPVLDGDHVYGNSAGALMCLTWPDGEVVWRAEDEALRLGEGGSLLRWRDMLVTLSERGKLSLVRATPKGVRLVSQVQLFDAERIWATPLLYDGKLYAKGSEELVCVDVSGGGN
jgi:outer membrane protein assembly factor BamB